MFDTRGVGFAVGLDAGVDADERVAELRQLAGKVAPVVLAGEQLIAVTGEVASLLPNAALRRGAIVSVEGKPGSGATSLIFQLVANASATGSWVAMVGLRAVGAVAAAEAGVHLERLALVPEPGGNWPLVTAALLDAVDIVVLQPSTRVRPRDARQLATRARDRGAVLIVAGAWPEGADVRLATNGSRWDGIARGHGVLCRRSIDVTSSGRGAAARQRRREIVA